MRWPIIGSFLLLLVGCSRAFYRSSADQETYPIIQERIVDPAFDIGRTQLEADAQSRLADPTNLDRPPKPPDDPAAALFMANPGYMKGAKGWEKDGVLDSIELPGWEETLSKDEQGRLPLTQNKAVELALQNSREYQLALEGVYQTALSLTLNRFEFDLRYFARNRRTYTRFGTGGFPTETNTLEVASNVGFNRNFAAGGQLLVDFANSFVFEFTGRTRQVTGNLGIALIQPLLRGFSRKVRLENLTQAERDTLYAVRDFARFRKQFWANIAIQPGGYLDLLLQVQRLRNAQSNLQSQEENVRLHEFLFKGGKKSPVDVDRAFQDFQRAKLSLIQVEVGLQDAQDLFKLQLGIQPHIPIDLQDDYLKQFVLVDPEVDQVREDLVAFQRVQLADLDNIPDISVLKERFDQLKTLANKLEPKINTTQQDLERWGKGLVKPLQQEEDASQRERNKSTFSEYKDEIPKIRQRLNKLMQEMDQELQQLSPERRELSWNHLVGAIKKAISEADTLYAIQTQARINLIQLPDVDISEPQAVMFAQENRLDLQNVKGQVTDNWRRVTVAANALQGDLNIVSNINIVTDFDANNPFAFGAEASRYAVGVQIDGPLNRLAERNVYRASLISYQQSRRNYMQLTDQIEFALRSDIRRLRLQRVSFEIARQRLLSAARQLEAARVNLTEARGQRNLDDTSTINLLNALDNLLNARNDLVGSFISFEQTRIQLLLDMEALRLDNRGFPTDESLRTSLRTTSDFAIERTDESVEPKRNDEQPAPALSQPKPAQ